MAQNLVATVRVERDDSNGVWVVHAPDVRGAVGVSKDLDIALTEWIKGLRNVYPFANGSQRDAISRLVAPDERN